MRTTQRFGQIDLLRALAILLVLGRHMQPCPAELSPVLHAITSTWAHGGWVGVDLFFVLSGFLVAGLLFSEYRRHGELRVGHFLVRRGFKIYPPFWLLIAFTVGLFLSLGLEVPGAALASELLFVQNYGPSLWYHTWSLAIEEHFYLCLGVGLALLAWRRADRPFAPIPAIVALIAVACLALRLLTARQPFSPHTHYVLTHLRLDGLAFGVLLAYANHVHPAAFAATARRHRWPLLTAGILGLVPAFVFALESWSIHTFGFTLFYIASGCLLVAALGMDPPRSRAVRGIATAGAHSYSIYLWHMPMALWGALLVTRLLGAASIDWFLYAATYLVGSVALGIGLTRLVEIPVLRLRDRLFPSRAAALLTEHSPSMMHRRAC